MSKSIIGTSFAIAMAPIDLPPIPIHSTPSTNITEHDHKRGDHIKYITQQEYDRMIQRIEQLQLAQNYNQVVINQLVNRMHELENIYHVTLPLNRNTNPSHHSPDDTEMS